MRRTSPTSSSCRRVAATPRPFVALRILLLEPGGNRGQLGLRLLERDVRLEPRDREEIVCRATGRTGRLGKPEIGLARELEALAASRRRWPGRLAHTNRPLEHAGVAAEAACQYAWLISATGLLVAGTISSGANVRPMIGLTCEDAKELGINGGASPILRRGAGRHWEIPRGGSWTSPRTTEL